ncbi:MAG TPA: hypothetical protein VGH87_11440 [Polyangiaceae bacterium]|jgi:hypothetical protein
MRLFDENTSWDDARRAMRFTAAALKAAPEHEKLAGAFGKLLASWKVVDEARHAAEDATVDANALVHFHDVMLDGHVTRLASRARADHGEDSREFAALFPEPPNEVIKLGLESEIERVKKWDGVKKESSLSKGVLQSLKDIDQTCARGQKALAAREAGVTEAARVSLRVSKWKDDANGARRSVETALDDYANKHSLGRDYASAFFPIATRAKKTKTPPPPTTPPTT